MDCKIEITGDLQSMPSDLRVLFQLRYNIEKHFRKEKTWGFYLKDTGYTVCRLNKLTRFYFGKTVYELIQDRVYTEAICLLKNSRLTIREITFELGMEDPAYFTRCFKRKMGIGPKLCRKSV